MFRGVLMLGHNPNASMSRPVLKPISEEKSQEIFERTNINITTDARKDLVGYNGRESEVLSKIAKTELQTAANAAFVSGSHINWRITSEQCLTLSNTGRDWTQLWIIYLPRNYRRPHMPDAGSADKRFLLSLPVKKGGLAISIFSAVAVLSLPTPAQLLNSCLNISTIKTPEHQWIVNKSRPHGERLPIPEKN